MHAQHNSMHASDVLQAVHQILCQGGLLTERGYADPLTQLACYVAAIVHDYEHKVQQAGERRLNSGACNVHRPWNPATSDRN